MKKAISIIGGGPSALMLAATLNETLFDITIYERRNAVGRKFLVAGEGGFNLTHSEPSTNMIKRYSPSSFLENALLSFTNLDLQKWLESIGIETYKGSSKRIFPVKGIKPIQVLNAILKVLKTKSVKIKTQHFWNGWDVNNELIFSHYDKIITVKSDLIIFALGGASWAKTGSDGKWIRLFEGKGIQVIPFQSSNCNFTIDWNPDFIKKAEGEPIKNIEVYCNGFRQKGELIITKSGVEGGAIYALSPAIRNQLNTYNEATITIDLKHDTDIQVLIRKLETKGYKSMSEVLKNVLNLNAIHIGLIKSLVPKEIFKSSVQLAAYIKGLPLKITGMGPIDEAISTVGGISLNETDENYQLKKLPFHYVIGEMLDWDAPTGGYLLQGCFSMGYFLGRQLNSSITP